MSEPLPTLNQYLNYPQTIPPAHSTVPDQNRQQPQQQPFNPSSQGNWNQPSQGNNNQGNWGQPQQGNYNQGNWGQPQQGNWGNQPQQGNYNQSAQGYYNNFSNQIYYLRSQYGMNIPDNQIDQTFEAAKANKRMYAFPDKETMYVKYDERGKSYILSTHSIPWVHKDNSKYYGTKNFPGSYDGKVTNLIQVCWIDIKLNVKHIKPGNYQLYLNQAFENEQIKNQMKLKVLVGDKEVYHTPSFPNNEMVKSKNLTEHFICNIKRNDFDYNKLDGNGDAVVRVEFSGNNNNWKRGWIFDGIRLLEV